MSEYLTFFFSLFKKKKKPNKHGKTAEKFPDFFFFFCVHRLNLPLLKDLTDTY